MCAAPALTEGKPAPLGATWDGRGINFAVFSRHAEKIELCLFDATGRRETWRAPLPARDGDIWHGYLEGAQSGLLYGYRAHGPYAPLQGHRFNPNKLLVDPYARAIAGTLTWNDALCGYRGGHDHGIPDDRDSAAYTPRARVTAPIDIGDRPARPHTPWADTLIYEMHLRGFTMRHPAVPESQRGTAAALSEPAVIGHLQTLGITAIELLPVAAFVDEWQLVQRGLRNYWGYNPLAPLAMHPAYLATGDVAEFARSVDRLHEAGIEVILDVVFNHTAENDEFGPTLAYRGLDNGAYYRLQPGHPDRYENYSGCGNTLDLNEPRVVELVHAALRYWACEVRVDGFRFDLAAALARDRDGQFDARAPLLEAIRKDPDLRRLKLIAEPWDVGNPGHFLGGFPEPFVEWNDRYRDGVRRYWRGDDGILGEFATRFAGSSDIYRNDGRQPTASLNFITAHDGFTLADLTAYGAKHNEDNGEDNRDGSESNWSSNGGIEGPVDDPDVLERRRRLRRSLLATLILSRGTPMLLAGDELSHTQLGNNNAYCQDNPVSWLDWSARGDPWRDQVTFVRLAVALRSKLRVLREQRFFDGLPIATSDAPKDIAWLGPDGQEMQNAQWLDPAGRALGILISGTAAFGLEQLFLALNPGEAPVEFTLPGTGDGAWLCVLDSSSPAEDLADALHPALGKFTVEPHTLLALVPRRAPGLGITETLSGQARDAGIEVEYTDITGTRRQVAPSALVRLIEAAGGQAVPDPTPPARSRPRCWLPGRIKTPPGLWALSVQLYSLRSATSWGIGDYADLAQWIDIAARTGASGVLLSPVHAPALSQPERASPYAPSSRLMLNPLLISVPAAAGMAGLEPGALAAGDADMHGQIERLNTAGLIDYTAVSRLKTRALRRLHRAFRDHHLGASPSPLGETFRRFRRQGGAQLSKYATFEALSAWFSEKGGTPSPPRDWPAEYRRSDSRTVEAFAREHPKRVEFYAYLQWVAREQWRAAAERAREAGMTLGLIADLALGTDPEGAEPWQWPGLVARDAELGAPPDAFAPHGQAWAAPPWRPGHLAELDYAPFDALLEAVMQDAGAIRLDHVMGLTRQFWIPRGEPPGHGAYVTYPLEILLARLAAASRKHHCMVIGEDLGNVPAGLRERLSHAGILGYRLLYFERDRAGAFKPPDAWTELAAAAASTHDLPTLNGFLAAVDIDERAVRGLYAHPSQVRAARIQREKALQSLETLLEPYGGNDRPQVFATSAHRFLAATASRLVIVQLEDVLGLQVQANLPGLGDEAPNWRRRLPVALEDLAADPRLDRLASIFARRSRFSRSFRSTP